MIPVGRVVLNRNPKNYFAEVEQSAFSPAHMVPGIEPSPDKMLQVMVVIKICAQKLLVIMSLVVTRISLFLVHHVLIIVNLCYYTPFIILQ